MNIKKNYSLSNYNSFCVDHSTHYFIEIENKNQIVSFLKDKKYFKLIYDQESASRDTG